MAAYVRLQAWEITPAYHDKRVLTPIFPGYGTVIDSTRPWPEQAVP